MLLTARKSSGQCPPPAFARQSISSRPSDAWNRLVEVRADDAGDPGVPGALIATYRYNGLNHRVQKILWDDADPQTPDTTIDYYHNAGWQVVEERVDGDVHAQYLWCPSYIDTPVLRWRDTSEVPDQELDETLYYTVDANKNVTALIDAATGNVVERYLYDPYGRVMALDDGWDSIAWSASRKNEILFAGYRYNPETGYYHVRHREFHPLLGRWMQRDPLGYVDGGNLYAGYFVMWGGVDPWGTKSLKEQLADAEVTLRLHLYFANRYTNVTERNAAINEAIAYREETVRLIRHANEHMGRIDPRSYHLSPRILYPSDREPELAEIRRLRRVLRADAAELRAEVEAIKGRMARGIPRTLVISLEEDVFTSVAGWWLQTTHDFAIRIRRTGTDFDLKNAIASLNDLDLGDHGCLSKVTITGHGTFAGVGAFNIASLKQNNGNEDVFAILDGIKRLWCKEGPRVVRINSCEVGGPASPNSDNPRFTTRLSQALDAPVVAWDDTYAIIPHGREFTAYPDGKVEQTGDTGRVYKHTIKSWIVPD
ncbi:MAG: RHS repeat-associated core domain-containing protein [Phycisphaeraceae bacterium]|nr:RHS repeat-associated core domain-containing protein [Phycisphaeraceae bacterium]